MRHSVIEAEIRRKNSERFSRREPMTLSEVFHKTSGMVFALTTPILVAYANWKWLPSIIEVADIQVSTQIPTWMFAFVSAGLGMAYGTIDGKKTIQERVLELNHGGLQKSFVAMAAVVGLCAGIRQYENDQCQHHGFCDGITISARPDVVDCPKPR